MGKGRKGNGGKAKEKSKTTPTAPMATRSRTGSKKPEGRACTDDLGKSLAALGLRIRKVTADGNCFFRACSDQLFGGEQMHVTLRNEVVTFMQDHEADFGPYMEDDESFDSYCKRMNKVGVWAGQQEQVALTRLKGVKICVHQQDQPSWTIAPDFPEIQANAATLHLSYHDGEHYNSVRLEADMGGQPATPIVLANGNAKAADCNDMPQPTSTAQEQTLRPDEEQNGAEVRWTEQQGGQSNEHNGGMEPMEMALDEETEAQPAKSNQFAVLGNLAAMPEDERGPRSDKPEVREDKTMEDPVVDVKPRTKQKAPTRNGRCPCGSNLRFKNCCGPAKKAAARRAEQGTHSDPPTAQVIAMKTIFV